jgi:O-antigen/teichoic acid export membrane protein
VSQLRKSLVYMVPTVVAAAFPLVTLPIFTRVLTPEDYGVLALSTVYALFTTGLANLGLPLAFERNFFQQQDESQAARLLYSVLAFVLPLLALGAFLTWLFGERLSHLVTRSPHHGAILLASYATFATQSIKLYYLTWLKNRGEARAYAWYSIDETLLWTCLSLLFVVVLRIGPLGVPLGQFIGSAAVTLVLGARFVRKLPPAVDGALLREALVLGLPLTPRLFITIVSNNFDKYILGMLGGLGGVGVYSVGQKMSSLVFSAMTALQNVFAPGVYSRMFAGGKQAAGVGRYLTPFAYASVGIALLVGLFAEEALMLLTPPEFRGAALVVNVLAVYYAILFFGKQPQLVYARRTALVSLVGFISMLLHVSISIAFVSLWGTLGAAWAVLAAGALSTAFGVWLGQRYFRIDYESARLLAIYAVLAGACVATYLHSLAGAPYPVRLLLKAGAVMLYGWTGYRFGLLRPTVLRAAVKGRSSVETSYAEATGDR